MCRFALSVAVALLAGCGAGVPVASDRSGAPAASILASGSPSSGILIYVSRGPRVYVFSFPQGKLVQRLAGFNLPAGICTDRSGDVWIADARKNSLIEYAHGGRDPIATLGYPKGLGPYDCAVDPKTGDLAAVGYHDGVAIYRHAQGKPSFFRFSYMNGVAYDDRSDLFAVGQNLRSHKPTMAELIRGASRFVTVRISEQLAYPDRLRWDGKYLAMTTNQSAIYRISVADRIAKAIGSMKLRPPIFPLFFDIHNHYIIVSDERKVMIWRYPQGGSPFETLYHQPRSYGVALSGAP